MRLRPERSDNVTGFGGKSLISGRLRLGIKFSRRRKLLIKKKSTITCRTQALEDKQDNTLRITETLSNADEMAIAF
jgi:hypothetical protein